MLLSLYNIFVFIALGYIANRARLLGKKHSGILLGFLLNFAIPAQIFNGIYHADFDFALLGMIVCALASSTLGCILMFCFAKFVLKANRTMLISLTFMVGFGNILFLGLPIVQGTFGAHFSGKAILFDQICTVIPFAFIAPLILAISGKGSLTFGAVARRLFGNPLFLALLSGITARALPFRIDEDFLSPLYAIGACAIPVGLFSIGVQLSFASLREVWRETSAILVFKMLISPLLLFGALKLFGVQMNDDWTMILILSSMPPLTIAAAVIMQAGLNAKVAMSSVALGVICSAASAPLFMWLASL